MYRISFALDTTQAYLNKRHLPEGTCDRAENLQSYQLEGSGNLYFIWRWCRGQFSWRQMREQICTGHSFRRGEGRALTLQQQKPKSSMWNIGCAGNLHGDGWQRYLSLLCLVCLGDPGALERKSFLGKR